MDGAIEFDDVSSATRAMSALALKNVSLHIKAGQFGILGGTGSAEVHAFAADSRLYDTTHGTVKVGGVGMSAT